MPLTTTSAYAGSAAAAASGQESKPYPSGQERASAKNADLGHNYGDLADQRDKGK